jgi:hypothetical protein
MISCEPLEALAFFDRSVKKPFLVFPDLKRHQSSAPPEVDRQPNKK